MHDPGLTAGNTDYAGPRRHQGFTVTPAVQTITFGTLPNVAFGTLPSHHSDGILRPDSQFHVVYVIRLYGGQRVIGNDGQTGERRHLHHPGHAGGQHEYAAARR